ncbi:MAG TPA: aminotransferase class V-fold PLP-dependent enzyme [Anaerolineae bacterium]|nr:aminotransferase class V-fold PLP-dependent enzyme [Anaerolineae bacterium]
MLRPSLTTDMSAVRERIVGVKQRVPLLNGETRTYLNFDNAASTPALSEVRDTVNNFLGWYSSVHRGAGFKSRIATQAYDDAREIVAKFVGANPREHVVIFGKNTTEAINKLARRFPLSKEDVVLVSLLEHHSNDLPWRNVATVDHVTANRLGELDEADFDRKLERYAGRLKLVAITGASNVTGFLPPIHRLAEKAHAAGAQILVDGAQLAPHRPISVGALDDPAHLDYVAISAHKMYAPFGAGALIGRRDTFAHGAPDYSGGGTIEIVTVDSIEWAEPPDRDEAGSPNVVGAVALAAAAKALQAIGMTAIADHEAELTAYTLERLRAIDGVEIYGDPNPASTTSRLGVIPFNIKGLSHFLVAVILGAEFGIGVRNGCFCAHPYLLHLLGLSPEEAEDVRRQMQARDRREMPGMVRISFGMYNTAEEVDVLIDAVQRIARGKYYGRYQQDTATGEYRPVDWNPDLGRYFKL